MSLTQKYNSLPATIKYGILGGGLILDYIIYKKITSTETTTQEAQFKLKKQLMPHSFQPCFTSHPNGYSKTEFAVCTFSF